MLRHFNVNNMKRKNNNTDSKKDTAEGDKPKKILKWNFDRTAPI